jgi:hypothetical protein
MITCSNCGGNANPKDALVVSQAIHSIAVICGACQENLVVTKIVFKRPAAHRVWEYEGYLPVETEKKRA